MRKKIIRKTAEYLFLLLLFCTVVSAKIERIRLPQVTVSALKPGTVVADGEEEQYEYTVPVSALRLEGERYWVYALGERDGKFGKEQYVQLFPAEVLAQDEERAALRASLFDEIVVEADRTLEDGAQVMVQKTEERGVLG